MANKDTYKSNSPPPLDSIKYLASPLSILLESMNDPQNEFITLHDLTEGYATITRRIRLQASQILAGDPELPALAPFKADNLSLSICLTRDIGRCLLNPLTIFSQPQSISDDGSMLEEGTERAQGYATLSHHALVFLSDVFSLTPVMNIFSVSQLGDLLREVLLILSSQKLPTPNSKKTWSLAAWILTVQRLPPDVLLPFKRELKKVLSRLLCGDFEGHTHINEGLKLLSALLRTHLEFIELMLPLYPSILALTTENAFDVRMRALKTLRCIVALKLDSPNSEWSRQIASQTASFIKSQMAKQKESQGYALQGVLSSAISDTEERSNKKGPLWASLTVACLICLSDAHLFTHPHSLKLFLSILARATKHKRSYIRALHPHIWNCLVWCHSRLPDPSKDPGARQEFGEIRKRAFFVLRQELKGGIATALTASLLSSSSFVIGDILFIVKDLLSASKESQIQEGIKILARLVSNLGSLHTGTQNHVRDISDIVFHDLFVGTFLDLPEEKMKALSARLPTPDERFVRPLTEVQVRDNWENFLQVWVHGISCTHALGVNHKQFERQLLGIWHSLLLAQSQLTHNSALLSMSAATVERVASTITSFIAHTNDTAQQVRQLHLVHKLWSVIKQSYDTHHLVSLAESVLSAILKQKYALDEEEVKVSWSSLCGSLASVGIPKLMPSLFAQRGSWEMLEVQQQLWVTVAGSGLFKMQKNGWEETISFLSIPLQSWSLDLQELDIWTQIFKGVLESAEPRVTAEEVVNALLQKLRGGSNKGLISSPGVLPVLLPHFRFNTDNVSHHDLLHIINGALVKLYPPAPGDLILGVPILMGVGYLVASTDDKDILQLLLLLKDGLCAWIRDETKSLLDHEHHNVVRDIYCVLLTGLSRFQPPVETLQVLSAFLTSTFERPGHPPIGPLAFEHFWRTAYHHQPESVKRLIPDSLKTCLKAWSDHCGDSLAEGIPSITDSQITPKSVIQDSQPPNKIVPRLSEVDASMDFDDIYNLVLPSSDHVPMDVEESQHTPNSKDTLQRLVSQRTRDPDDLEYFTSDEGNILRTGGSGQQTSSKRSSSQAPLNSRQTHKRRRTESNVTSTNSANLEAPINRNPTLYPITDYSEAFTVTANRTPRTPVRKPHHHGPGEVPVLDSTSRSLVQRQQQDKGESGTMNLRDEDDIINDSAEMEHPLPLLPKGNKLLHSRLFKPSPVNRLRSEPPIESGPPSRPTPLRRNHTTSDRLGALERAYTLVAEAQGTSQVPIEELAHAARLAHEIGAKINAQLTQKLRKTS